jgi:polysaccharide export outer membrane protein
MRYFLFTCLISFVVLAGSSCSYKQNQVLFERKSSLADSLAKTAPAINPYKIAPQDVLQVRNLQSIKYIVDDVPTSGGSSSGGNNNAAQGQTYQVEEDGTVALPVIGRVPVAGLTRLQAARKVEDMYRKALLKDPIIELKIINLKVTVLGEVKTPGNYPLVKDRTKLIEVLGEAGGLTDKANEKLVKIIRGAGNNEQTIEVDLGDIASLSNPQTILQNNDIIYIGQNRKAIRNESIQSTSTILQPALLLLNTVLVIFTLTR